MTKIASLARLGMLACLFLATLASTGCKMYPAGGCYSCGCGGCDSCGGMAMGGHGPDCGCGSGLAACKGNHGHELAETGPPAMPAPHARFHPVPTRPVFAPREPTLAVRAVEEQFDFQRDSTASGAGSPSRDRTASAEPTPRLARRPAAGELPLEAPRGTPTPATRPATEPRALPRLESGASLTPVPSSQAQPRRSVVSSFETPAGLLEATPAPEPAVQPITTTGHTASDTAWRARLMLR